MTMVYLENIFHGITIEVRLMPNTKAFRIKKPKDGDQATAIYPDSGTCTYRKWTSKGATLLE